MNVATKSTQLLKRSLKCLAVGLVFVTAAAASAEANDGRGHPDHRGHYPAQHSWRGHPGWQHRAHYYAPRPYYYAPRPVAYHYPVHYSQPGFTVVLPLNIR